MMDKFEVLDNGLFFGSKYRHLGLKILSDTEYYFGQVDDSFNPDGFGILVTKDLVGVGRVLGTEKKIPFINVTAKECIDITLDNRFEREYHLKFNPEGGGFSYEQFNDEHEIIDENYILDLEKEEIYLYDHSKRKDFRIDEKVSPNNAIYSTDPFDFPRAKIDFSAFQLFNGKLDDDTEYETYENSTETTKGLGIIIWADGDYSIGEYKNHARMGWHLFIGNDFARLSYLHYGSIKGLDIIMHFSGEVSIHTMDGEFTSKSICYLDGDLSYSETESKSFLRDGDGFLIDGFNEIDFCKFKKGKPLDNEIRYIFNGRRFRRVPSLEEESQTEKCEVKEEEIKEEQIDAFHEEEKEVDIEEKLNALTGNENAKNTLQKIKAYIFKNDKEGISTHMVFTGNPGTGKSIFARLYAEFLYKNGVIKRNKCIECSAKEVISMFSGESKEKVESMVKGALGGLLYVSDAENLDTVNNAGYKEALDTFVTQMKAYKGEIAIVFGGPNNEMNELILNNPEFEACIKFRVHFPDYTRDELKEIVVLEAAKKKYTYEEDALNLLLDVSDLLRRTDTYGNARTALSINDQAIVLQNYRTINDKSNTTITIDDIRRYMDEHNINIAGSNGIGNSDARKELDNLVGLEDIKETIDNLVAYFAMNRNKNNLDFHMAFLGNPGTGKTEVARILGKLLNQEGLLPTNKFVEVTRADLVGKYIGHTAPKVQDVVSRAMGGVLYIDEAYSLAFGAENDFGAEAISELLKLMEDKRGEFCVIFAGYTQEMKKLFTLNPGLSSRVKFELEFKDYKFDEFVKIGQLFLKRDDYEMSEDNLNLLVSCIYLNHAKRNFANVRSLRESLARVEIKQAGRIRREGKQNRILSKEDIIAVFGKEIVEKAEKYLINKDEEIIPLIDIETLKNNSNNVPEMPFEQSKEKIKEAVVAIKMEAEDGGGESSGFVVSKDGYVVTCAHCVAGATKIDVRRRITHNGCNIDIHYPANIAAINKEDDVAIIKLVTEDEFEFVPLLKEEEKDLEPLSQVFILGYPFGVSRFDQMSINEGKIASYQRDMDEIPDQINLDISAKGGNSGSLIVDGKTSRVIGILCGASLSYNSSVTEEINYCRPISYIYKLIRENKKEN